METKTSAEQGGYHNFGDVKIRMDELRFLIMRFQEDNGMISEMAKLQVEISFWLANFKRLPAWRIPAETLRVQY